MILYDAPAFRQLPEDQGKTTSRIILCSLELPPSEHDRGVGSKRRDFQIRKSEGAHFVATRISRLVAFEDRLPPAGHFVARDKGRPIRARVTVHKSIQVTRIPSRFLVLNYLSDLGSGVGVILGGQACRETGAARKKGERYGRENASSHDWLLTPIGLACPDEGSTALISLGEAV